MRPDGSTTTPRGIWLHEAGTGPLVVLVHGAMDRSGGMLRVRRLLHRDHRVVRYDRRGYGRSKLAPPGTDFDEQVADLVEVLDGRPAVLGAHSFGGIVALAVAARYPSLVRAVVAYETPIMWAPWWRRTTPDERPEDAAEWFMRRMIGDAMWDRLPRSMREDRRAEGRALIAELRSVVPPAPVPFVASELTVPVLAAHGSRARSHHRRAATELAASAPLGSLHVVEGADHGIHLSDPAGFASLVRLAVARASAPSSPSSRSSPSSPPNLGS